MKNLALLVSVCLFFVSCQKEISFEDPNANPPTGGGSGTGGTTTGTKLVRIGHKIGTDSLTETYTYNSSTKITLNTAKGNLSGTAVDFSLAFIRNNSGIITKTVIKSLDLAQFGVDSLVYVHTYDASKARYANSVLTITIPGLGTKKDSIAYVYDGSNNLTGYNAYENDGTGYVPVYKYEYTYSGSNVASSKSYDYDSGSAAFVLSETATYEYDTKTNPLQFSSEAALLSIGSDHAVYYSANNITKVVTTTVTPSGVTTDIISYTYTSNNRPAKATTTQGVSTYYYQ